MRARVLCVALEDWASRNGAAPSLEECAEVGEVLAGVGEIHDLECFGEVLCRDPPDPGGATYGPGAAWHPSVGQRSDASHSTRGMSTEWSPPWVACGLAEPRPRKRYAGLGGTSRPTPSGCATPASGARACLSARGSWRWAAKRLWGSGSSNPKCAGRGAQCNHCPVLLRPQRPVGRVLGGSVGRLVHGTHKYVHTPCRPFP
jgi:hypothetical protein